MAATRARSSPTARGTARRTGAPAESFGSRTGRSGASSERPRSRRRDGGGPQLPPTCCSAARSSHSVSRVTDPETPFADAVDAFLREAPTSFSTPGHKRNPALTGADPLLPNDAPMHGGADDLRGGKRIRARAERLAAAAFGADLCRFSGNGSTHPNQALCLAVASEGAPVIVSRCSHKSVAAGLVLSGARPVWIAPAVDEARGV